MRPRCPRRRRHQAYAVFPAATGGIGESHDILLNWTFADSARILAYVPEPGSTWSLGLGLAGLAARRASSAVPDPRRYPPLLSRRLHVARFDGAIDLAAQLARTLGGPEKLRAEITNQRIDFDTLSPELQDAFKRYFEPVK